MVRLEPECVNGYGRPISPLLPAGYAHPRLTPHAQRHKSHRSCPAPACPAPACPAPACPAPTGKCVPRPSPG
jgi:hypothetical protein